LAGGRRPVVVVLLLSPAGVLRLSTARENERRTKVGEGQKLGRGEKVRGGQKAGVLGLRERGRKEGGEE
jgi:hypothetical protein